MNKEKKILGHILSLFIILLSISGVCLLMYKAQFRFNLHQPIEYVMMTTHKPTGTITLSSDSPVLTETFTCTVPELKMFTLEGTAKNKNSDARLFITLTNADSGEIYYQAEHTLSVFRTTKKKELTCNLSQPVSASENAHLQLKLKLINGDKTVLSFTSNEKQTLVQEFNNDTNSHTNIIYSFTYGDNNFMLYFYIALCVILLLFIIMTFYLIIIRQMTVQKFYIPVALFLGLIFQCLVTVHGVPDEPTHFDAAYSLSNKMLFVKNTETPGNTIYKRRCDAQLSDMLSNGLETNSYYQLLFHSFEFASDADLIEISYVSTSGLVPAVVYVPAAIGLSIGRLLHLSPMLTFQLARICSLVVFILLVYFAICIAPFGKNLLGALGLLPITLQQAASASYDSVINGFIFLFTALCFYSLHNPKRKKSYLIALGFLALFIAIVKGGVYLPLLLLLLMCFSHVPHPHMHKKMRWIVPLCICMGAVLLIAVTLIKFMPMFSAMFATDISADPENTIYPISYVFQHPLQTIYILWNTVIQCSDTILRGLLGGKLSWLDININWSLLIVFLIILLLLVNVKGDAPVFTRKNRTFIAFSCLGSLLLIMFSMMVGYTTMDCDHIQGIQGRYFLPLAPALFSLFSTAMVSVDHNRSCKIWETMMVIESLVVVQAITMII